MIFPCFCLACLSRVNPSFQEDAKRKRDDDYCTFQQEWTEEFAFVERAGSAVCLICNDKISSMK